MDKVYSLCLPVDISLELFDQLVLPDLLYGCEIWDLVTLPKFKFCIENISKYYRTLQILIIMLWFMGKRVL